MTGNRNRIALLLVLLLVGAAGVLWWADSRRLATANQSVAHTQEVSRQIELLAGNCTRTVRSLILETVPSPSSASVSLVQRWPTLNSVMLSHACGLFKLSLQNY